MVLRLYRYVNLRNHYFNMLLYDYINKYLTNIDQLPNSVKSLYNVYLSWTQSDLIISNYEDDAIAAINPDNLTITSTNFPDVSYVAVFDYINNKYISLDLINRAKRMIPMVESGYTPSIDRDHYLALLKILTNQDIDISPFIINHYGQYIPPPAFVSVAGQY